ncbi:MAG TPA: multicopper oxidase family protein [Labilithrix sp.]|nr:multicopper oxidase family protein [Labilithrix sp.]
MPADRRRVTLVFVASGFFLAAILAGACASESDGAPHLEVPDGAASDAARPPRRPLAELWGAPTLVDENPDPEIVEVRLRAAPARFMIDDREVEVLAYNGTVPGPILQARPGQRVIVHFDNNLDEATTIHWHGLRIPASMDGSPRIQSPVPPNGSFTYDFVVPEAASFWYHPHVNTHDQLERGLHGAIVIQDDLDPAYDLERSLVLDDVTLDAEGNIAPPNLSGLDALTGRWGKTLLTNGRAAKHARGRARRGQVERWRLVNVANARKMPLRVEGARVRLIATDGGLLTAPVDVTKDLVLPVGGRLDLEVSYDRAGSARLVVIDGGTPVTMLDVDVEDGTDAPRAVSWPDVRPAIPERSPTSRFDITFDFDESGGSSMWSINGRSHWTEPMLRVSQGATVKMRIASAAAGGVAHPFHLHGQFFRVLDNPDWPGLRDTVQVPEFGPIEIVAYFDNPGMWMAHCHILEHAELGMMSEIEVIGADGPAPPNDAGHGH